MHSYFIDLGIEVRGHLHAPTALTQIKETPIHIIYMLKWSPAFYMSSNLRLNFWDTSRANAAVHLLSSCINFLIKFGVV
jgi:hypothetical protein